MIQAAVFWLQCCALFSFSATYVPLTPRARRSTLSPSITFFFEQDHIACGFADPVSFDQICDMVHCSITGCKLELRH
jgi:hypothetical protein